MRLRPVLDFSMFCRLKSRPQNSNAKFFHASQIGSSRRHFSAGSCRATPRPSHTTSNTPGHVSGRVVRSNSMQNDGPTTLRIAQRAITQRLQIPNYYGICSPKIRTNMAFKPSFLNDDQVSGPSRHTSGSQIPGIYPKP